MFVTSCKVAFHKFYEGSITVKEVGQVDNDKLKKYSHVPKMPKDNYKEPNKIKFHA